jgi:cell division protein FtsB
MASKLEDRVTELERQISDLKDEVQKNRLAPAAPDKRPSPDKDAWRATVGIFKDDQFYDDMVRLGRAWRQRQPKC